MSRILLLILCLTLAPLAGADPVAQEAMSLARLGAADLALATLDRQPPDRLAHPERWMARERARLEILGMEARWEAVADRAARLPAGLPHDFLIWARTRQAHALLALERPGEARELLRDLIWFSGDAVSSAWLDAWRRMLAESYQADDMPADALSTLRRLRQDRGDEAEIPLPLEARILMDQARDAEAARLLQGATAPEARALRALAMYRAGLESPDALIAAMQTAAASDGLDGEARARYLAVAALVSDNGEDPAGRAAALEAAMAHQGRVPTGDRYFRLPPDALWEAYLILGEAAGNERHLLIGDDEAWFAAVDKLAAPHAVTARGLLSVVALRGQDAAARETAHRRLGESLLEETGGADLVDALYLAGPRFDSPERVPAAVRHLLAEHALGRGDLDTASALMADLASPPEGVDRFEWGLRRSRLLILGGQEEAGIDGLYDLLSAVRRLESEAADRFMQVLFDLQTVRRHDAAIHLFRAVATRLEDPRQLREVLYWEADSHKALGDHEEAARLYLRSASMGPGVSDPWGMTARFQAAEALAGAGLVSDARALYAGLLRVTREQERRVVLRQRLQELELR